MQKKALLILLIFISNISFSQIFTEQTDIVIPGIKRGSVDWGDYNNDGLLDFMLTGIAGIGDIYYSALFINNGDNLFSEHTGIIEDVEQSSLDWGDYNNDNYLDIALTGSHFKNETNNYYTEIYKNNTNASFSKLENAGLYITNTGSISWGDYNNDAYNDIFQSGYNFGDLISKIYRNNEDNTFIEQTDISIDGVWYGSVDWGDYNNDGYLDFVYTGTTADNKTITEIYKNIGENSFLIQNAVNLPGVVASTSLWGDYNNDGYIDLIISGQNPTKNISITKIFKNNGNETFTELVDTELLGVSWGSVIWGDYNNDGLLDISLTGWAIEDGLGETYAKIYKNDSNNKFIEQTDIIIIPVGYSATVWGDYDNDNDLDILLTGINPPDFISKIYKNNTLTPNSPPNVITNPQTEIKGNDVIFSWDEATDNNQPSAGLNYNIYVYDEDHREDILAGIPYEHQFVASPQAFIQNHTLNGKRLLAQRGHIQGIRKDGRVSYILKGVFDNCKKYYWSVQAIDASFAGGQFAPEAPFVFDNTAPEITCPTNQTIEIPQEQTTYTVQGNELDPVSYSDNCTYTIIENDYNFAETLQGEELPKGISTIEWMVTDTVGNTAQCSFDVEILAVSKVNDISNNEIEVYPNPSNGTFTIKFPLDDNNINTSISIKDIAGKQIFSSKTKDQSQTIINLKSYPKGVYFLTLSNLNFHKTTKVITQ